MTYRTEYDSHAPDWHPSLQEQAEMRRERASLAWVAAALGLVVCLVMGWSCVAKFDSTAEPRIPFDIQGGTPQLE